MEYCIALSDSLCKELHAFKHGQACDERVVEKMLHLYKPPHITNVEQLKRIGVHNMPLVASLAGAGLIGQTVEELAEKTRYRIILDKNRQDFPYVSINKDPLQNNYVLTCLPGQNREKATDYVKALLSDAKTLLICDKYIGENWRMTKRLFSDLLPQRKLSIFYTDDHLRQVVGEIKHICPQWTVKQDRNRTYMKRHDRYIRIDGTIEIIFTSGIDYLFDASKECTLVVRAVG